MSNAIPMPHTEHEVARALDIARHMATSGIPIFVAAPAPDSKAGYHFPNNWESTRADPMAVDTWRPGMALCALGGHSCDFLDVDPRNGGSESSERLWRDGAWPTSYGQQITPSGGRHEIIQPLRTGKGTPAPGIDVQGGRLDGTGMGFVFLAPTVRASKVDGKPRPYRWTVEPDLPRLLQSTGERSGAQLAALMPGGRGKVKPTDDAVYFAGETPHTTVAADATIMKHCGAVHDHARQGWNGFRDTLNRAAFAIGAYVGSGYLPYATAVSLLTSTIVRAGYLPDHADERWIEDGIEDGAARPIRVVQNRPLATAGTTVSGERFGSLLIDAADLDDLDDPKPIIDGWLYENTTARIVGQASSYKSFVTLDMALCVALGRDWHGLKVQQTPVLYVVGEGLSGYKMRVAAWLEHNGVSREELRGKLMMTLVAVQIGGPDWPGMTEWVREQQCRLVVVDTVARATTGLDENSNKEQGVVVEQCRQLCDATEATMLLVHHTGHANGEAAERGRGASCWRAAVDSEWLLTKTGDLTSALRNDRQKDARSGQTVAISMVEVAGSLAVKVDHNAPVETTKGGKEKASKFVDDERALKAVTALLDENKVPDVRSIVARAGMRHSKVREALDRLVDTDKLIKMPSPSGRGEAYRLNLDYSGTKSNSVIDHEVPEGDDQWLT